MTRLNRFAGVELQLGLAMVKQHLCGKIYGLVMKLWQIP